MKKQIAQCALSAAAYIFSSLAMAAPLHVVIDPGHGGHDDGAVRGKIREASIALSVSKKLADHLSSDPRFKITMTRETDKALTLSERKKIGREVKADLFLSIHANSSADARAQGVEFYFQNQMPADEEAMFLSSRENEAVTETAGQTDKAESFTPKGDLAHIIEDLKRNYRASASNELSKLLLDNWENARTRHHRRAIRQAPFQVVSDATMPAVLVELGFITHSQDAKKLTSDEQQNIMAKNLYEGLVQFKSSYDRDKGSDSTNLQASSK